MLTALGERWGSMRCTNSICRRSVLIGMSCALVPSAKAGAIRDAGGSGNGCRLPASAFRSHAADENVVAMDVALANGSMGDEARDGRLDQAVRRLADFCGLSPAVYFYDDSLAGNARAYPPDVPKSDGRVKFGRNLFKYVLQNYRHGDFAVLTILAHEFGHIGQFKSPDIDADLTRSKLYELHADFMAGFYLADLCRNNLGLSFDAAYQFLEDMRGDDNASALDAHRTRDQRLRAAKMGFAEGRKGEQSFGGAMRIGRDAVLRSFETRAG